MCAWESPGEEMGRAGRGFGSAEGGTRDLRDHEEEAAGDAEEDAEDTRRQRKHREPGTGKAREKTLARTEVVPASSQA